MRVTQKVKKILDWYEGDPPGVKANLARILCTGKLGGTGKVVILPVDQGFEHGPARSFAPNPALSRPQAKKSPICAKGRCLSRHKLRTSAELGCPRWRASWVARACPRRCWELPR